MQDPLQSGPSRPSISWVGAPQGAAVDAVILPQVRDGQVVGYTYGPELDTENRVKTFKDGSERPQIVFLVQTPWRNREGVSVKYLSTKPDYQDDGIRWWYCTAYAVAKAKAEAARIGGFHPGTRLRISLDELKPNPLGNEPIKIIGVVAGPADAESMKIMEEYKQANAHLFANPGDPLTAAQPQQPAQGQWGAQPAQPQQPAQGQWGAQPAQPQQPAQGQWGAQPAQPQQPAQGQWGAQPAQPQQPAQGQPPSQPSASGGEPPF